MLNKSGDHSHEQFIHTLNHCWRLYCCFLTCLSPCKRIYACSAIIILTWTVWFISVRLTRERCPTICCLLSLVSFHIYLYVCHLWKLNYLQLKLSSVLEGLWKCHELERIACVSFCFSIQKNLHISPSHRQIQTPGLYDTDLSLYSKCQNVPTIIFLCVYYKSFEHYTFHFIFPIS